VAVAIFTGVPSLTFWRPSTTTRSPGLTLLNNPHRAGLLSHLHRPEADLVVTADHRYLIQTLEDRDGFLRHQQRSRPDIADEAHATVLTWA
jgi:hypothetical protein